MRLGIDSGNFNTKSSTGYGYKSGLNETASDPVGAECRISLDGRYFSVGESRDAIEKDKTASQNMLIQTLPAIAQAIEVRKLNPVQRLELGVGTPLKRFGSDAPKYKEYFLGEEIKFSWNGKPYQVTIDRVEVFPQGYAAYLANYEVYAGYKELNVIDIGGGTIDAFMISGGMPVTKTFVSLNYGVITLVNRCIDELEPEGIRIGESQVCDSIMEQENMHLNAELIAEVCRIERDEYIRDVLYKLRERGFDFSVPTVFIGGGSMLLKNFWGSYEINIVGFLDETANAKAYEVLLDREG